MSGYFVSRLVQALWRWLGGPRFYERYDRVIGGVAMAVILVASTLGIALTIVYSLVGS